MDGCAYNMPTFPNRGEQMKPLITPVHVLTMDENLNEYPSVISFSKINHSGNRNDVWSPYFILLFHTIKRQRAICYSRMVNQPILTWWFLSVTSEMTHLPVTSSLFPLEMPVWPKNWPITAEKYAIAEMQTGWHYNFFRYVYLKHWD